jgi:hypothetical protein
MTHNFFVVLTLRKKFTPYTFITFLMLSFMYALFLKWNIGLTEIQTSQPKRAVSHYYGINAQAGFRRHFAVFHNERLPDFI